MIILTDFDGCSLRGGGPLSLEQAQMVTTGLNCVQVHLISAVHALATSFAVLSSTRDHGNAPFSRMWKSVA